MNAAIIIDLVTVAAAASFVMIVWSCTIGDAGHRFRVR